MRPRRSPSTTGCSKTTLGKQRAPLSSGIGARTIPMYAHKVALGSFDQRHFAVMIFIGEMNNNRYFTKGRGNPPSLFPPSRAIFKDLNENYPAVWLSAAAQICRTFSRFTATDSAPLTFLGSPAAHGRSLPRAPSRSRSSWANLRQD